MTKPQTKSQFIRWLQTERDSWEGLLDQLSEAEMIAPNRLNEWSVKDVIAHIMSYEQFIVERVLELVRGEVYQPSETPEALTDFAERYGYPDFGSPLLDDDLPNAWVFQKYHSRSLKDVLALEKQTFIKLLQAVEQLSDKQLIATGIYEKLAQNTYIHYQEHAADILAMQNSQITIRPATLADAEKYSQLRLEALCEHPEAFGSDYQVNRQKSPTDWEAQLTQRIDGENAMLFFACADDELVGMTGIFRGNSPKARHNGGIWGVYVRAAYRGQGIATRLLEACIAWAADQQIEYLKLAVVTTNVAAIRCYAACGFRVYGLEPKVLRVNGVDYDELWMVREIESPVP